jgi:predicted deacylase
VIINRSKKKGPVILFTAGIHGDEVNGVEIIRQLISKGINRPKKGTIICIPVLNIFGFLNKTRELPDGRDLNRVFPGSKTGSLASQVAFKLMHEIIPQVNFIIDHHTGGAGRFNAPQIRIIKGVVKLKKWAKTYGAPYVIYSKKIPKSLRSACHKLNIPILLFEGGKSNHIDRLVTNSGVNGAKRILENLGMLASKFKVSKPKKNIVFIEESKWIRAKSSGLFRPSIKLNSKVQKETILGYITDAYGKFKQSVKADCDGYIINVNEDPIVYKGDALFRYSTKTSL